MFDTFRASCIVGIQILQEVNPQKREKNHGKTSTTYWRILPYPDYSDTRYTSYTQMAWDIVWHVSYPPGSPWVTFDTTQPGSPTQPGSGVLGFAVLNASRLFFGPDGKDVMSMPRYGMYGSNLTQEMDRNMDGLTWFNMVWSTHHLCELENCTMFDQSPAGRIPVVSLRFSKEQVVHWASI